MNANILNWVFNGPLVGLPLVVANVGLTPGVATFGMSIAAGFVPSGMGLKIGSLATQADVKTRWPDGSVKYAIVSGVVPTAATYSIMRAAPVMGSVSAAMPDAAVRLTIGGVVYTAALPSAPTSDLWLNGPVVTESRAVVTPSDPSNNPHPFLRVTFDTRRYAAGGSRLDVTVENELDIASSTSVTYAVDIVVSNQTVFHRDSVTHYWMTRWRKVFDLGGLTESVVTPDFESFYLAGALPRYLTTVANTVDSPTGPTFDLLGRGGLTYDDMSQVGGRPEIAPYPDWTVRYLIYKDPTQRQYVLANGDLAGSQPIHIRNSDGSRITIDANPDYWLDYRAHPWQPGPVGDWSARGPLIPDLAHQPSLAYVPYLLTGDRYYADEMTSWGDFDLLATFTSNDYPDTRGGSQGLLRGNQTRGVGWCLRNLTDVAAYLPDADPAKSYFAQKVANNLAWLDSYATTNVGPLGIAWLSLRNVAPGDPNGVQEWAALWEHNYVAWAIDHANQQGFVGGLLERNQIAQFQLTLFTSHDFIREDAAPYVLAIGINSGGVTHYFTTIAQVYQHTFSPPYQGPTLFSGNYGVDARTSLMIGMENGWCCAQYVYEYLTPQIASDLSSHAGWAVAPPQMDQ